MIYTIDKILQDVRVCIDQNGVVDALFEVGDIDTLTIDEIIKSKILEGVERVHMMAPLSLLHVGHQFEDPSIEWCSKESGKILLPIDFMRLVEFRMSDWDRPVSEAITPDHPLYKLQSSRIKALRGTAQRPVVAIVMSTYGATLEFYSCNSKDATIHSCVYIPYPSIDDNDGVDISERCYDAVVYMIAGLSLTSCGEVDKATPFLDMAKTYLEK